MKGNRNSNERTCVRAGVGGGLRVFDANKRGAALGTQNLCAQPRPRPRARVPALWSACLSEA